MRKLNVISLGLLLAASSAAFASNEGVVHFHGHVNEPTCSVVSAEQKIELDTISAAELSTVPIGETTQKGQKQFNINVNCEASNLQNNILVTMQGEAAAQQPKALSNRTDSNNGVGLEVFYDNQVVKPNDSMSGNRFTNLMNKGTDNLTMTVRYARLADEVKGGEVDSDVTFVSEYR